MKPGQNIVQQLARLGVHALATLDVPSVVSAQAAPRTARVSGSVVDGQGLALPGVTVVLRTEAEAFVASTTSTRTGAFRLSDLSPGTYVLTASLLGFEAHEQTLEVGTGETAVSVSLQIGRFAQEVTVSALMPEVATELVVSATEIESGVAQDLAQSLREHAGVTALRRGPINLDPSVRGLYAEQIGVFVDGTRTFAAGPARMDSGLSHVSPHALQSLRVVRGPYALTWGAGTLSAIQAETFSPPFTGGAFRLGGRAGYNFGRNGEASDAFAALFGSSDRIRFSVQHNTRTGSDYRDGHDATVAGHYESFDSRWDVGGRLGDRTFVTYDGGYQKQNDIDYPGRILDATFFKTQSHAGRIAYAPSGGTVSEVEGQVYTNRKRHRMNNDDKPTALDMPGRIPPFGLAIDLPASSDTTGGRFHVGLDHADVRYKIGVDMYRLSQAADRTISRRSNGVVLFADTVWPDAEITNVGVYGQAIRQRGRFTLGGTLRVDAERARVGEVSQFFRDHTTGSLSQENVNVSAAGNLSAQIRPGWVVNAGAGRAVRNPSVLERYSDRFPAVKFQNAAELMGDPALTPERSLEVNGGTVVRAGRATLEGDVFYRVIDDYITVTPDPALPKRLPLSPPVVFRYVQGEQARFVGFDLRAESAVGAWVDVRGNWSYVRARDTLFDEPLFGVPPFEQRYAVRVHSPDRARWVELAVTTVGDQNRVATARLESPTVGWTTLDLIAGVAATRAVTIRGGVQNLTNEFYANHLNSLNPFTGQRIAEVGRNGYVGAEVDF